MKNIGLLSIKDELLKCIRVKSNVTGEMLCEAIDAIISARQYFAAVKAFIKLLDICSQRDDTIYDSNNKVIITLDEDLETGRSASVYKCKFGTSRAVLKITTEAGAYAKFIRESLIQIILLFTQRQAQACYAIDSNYTCIPDCFALFKIGAGTDCRLGCVSEYLDNSILEITHALSDTKIVTLSVQIILALYYLQMLYGDFGHQDITPHNIMVQKRKQPIKLQVTLDDGFKFELITHYCVYLIDFELSCLNITKCLNQMGFAKTQIIPQGLFTDCGGESDSRHYLEGIAADEMSAPKKLITFATNYIANVHDYKPAAVIKALLKAFPL